MDGWEGNGEEISRRKRYLESDDHQGKEGSQVGSHEATRIPGVRMRFQLQSESRQVTLQETPL